MTGESSKRVQRVQRELFEVLAQYLQHNMPITLPCYAAVSAVDVTSDLRTARVFFRLVGEGPVVKETEAILSQERFNFQKHVVAHLKLKFTPVLRFEFGVAPHLDDVDRLFENLHKPKFGEE